MFVLFLPVLSANNLTTFGWLCMIYRFLIARLDFVFVLWVAASAERVGRSVLVHVGLVLPATTLITLGAGWGVPSLRVRYLNIQLVTLGLDVFST